MVTYSMSIYQPRHLPFYVPFDFVEFKKEVQKGRMTWYGHRLKLKE